MIQKRSKRSGNRKRAEVSAKRPTTTKGPTQASAKRDAVRSDVARETPPRGEALAEMLPQSMPPAPVHAPRSKKPPAASFPLVGSEVLDVVGSEGAPRRNMHDVIRTSDDEGVARRLGPLEEANVSFRPDPDAADAGADFADELGRSYLRSATTGEDMSEIENADVLEASEIGGPCLEIDTNAAPEDTGVEDAASADGLRNVTESIEIPRDERGSPAPATDAVSGEIPDELDALDALEEAEQEDDGTDADAAPPLGAARKPPPLRSGADR